VKDGFVCWEGELRLYRPRWRRVGQRAGHMVSVRLPAKAVMYTSFESEGWLRQGGIRRCNPSGWVGR
jgi:hypothetical protein